MNWEWKDYVGQALCIFATLLTFLSYQVNKKNQVLAVQTVATVSMCAGYFFLGATSGFALNIVGIVRNLCFYFQPAKGNFRYYSGAFFAVAMAVVGILFWQGPADILIITALVINSVMLSAFSAQALRYSILFTCTLMTAYAMIHVNIGAVCNESFSIVSSFVGILRYRQKSTEK